MLPTGDARLALQKAKGGARRRLGVADCRLKRRGYRENIDICICGQGGLFALLGCASPPCNARKDDGGRMPFPCIACIGRKQAWAQGCRLQWHCNAMAAFSLLLSFNGICAVQAMRTSLSVFPAVGRHSRRFSLIGSRRIWRLILERVSFAVMAQSADFARGKGILRF